MITEGEQYALDILSGKIISGSFIKLACKRYLEDRQRTDLDFNIEKADYVKKFIGLFHHYTGKFDKQKFNLLPWQSFLVENLYGFYWKDGRRRFNTSFIQLARKAGKTQLSAALCLYHLIADGEPDAKVFLAAASKDQANIAYSAVSALAKQLDPKEKMYKCYRSEIIFNKSTNRLKVLASDSTKLDGYNPSAYLIDEYHAHPTSAVRDVLKSGIGMRISPMEILISTAGFNKLSPCYTLRTTCIDILHGLKQDDSLFTMIFELDENDDWELEENWIKAQPNLDVTVTRAYMRNQVVAAKNNPTEEVGILTKNFNKWCDAENIWINSDVISRNSKSLNIEDFRKEQCYVGVDLASVQDLTAVAYMFFKDGKRYVFIKYYIPAESLNTRADKELYKDWCRRGLLTVTQGNVTDYDYITKDILDMSNICKIKHIAYDKWNSTQWATQATVLRLPLEEYSQSIGNFNAPTRELERLLLSDEIILDNNEILRWNFENVQLKRDHNGNVKPSKEHDKKKIDGVIAVIQALAMLIKDSAKPITKIHI